MYYKIEDQDCLLFETFKLMREEERQIGKDNLVALNDKLGLVWINSLGFTGQQTWSRTREFEGFEFKYPQEVDLKTWRLSKDHEGIFVPNLRSKAGREMRDFLHSLKGNFYTVVYDILEIKRPSGRFTLPFVEYANGVIIIHMGDIELDIIGVVEITKKEAMEHLETLKTVEDEIQ